MHVFLFFVFLFFCYFVPFDRRCISFSANGWDMSNSTPRVQIRWHGVGGRTVERTLKLIIIIIKIYTAPVSYCSKAPYKTLKLTLKTAKINYKKLF